MSEPWNDLYHCSGNTYGTWLPGDPRGFRGRRHRRHVEGDYRNPPQPGAHSAILKRSRALLKRSPVHLDAEQRQVAAAGLVEKLLSDQIELIALAVDDHHFHVMGRFTDGRPRHWVGRAKMHASMRLREHRLAGQVWTRSSHAQPIRDRGHQVNTFAYIVEHRRRGAAVWTFRDLRA